MKYLIACDLDGTTLNRQGELTQKTIQVLRHLKKEGHLIVLATGRPYNGAIGKYEEIGLDTPLITDNGGSIENPMDSAFAKQRTYIPVHMMHKLFTFAKDMIISSFFSIDDVVYAYKYDKKLEEFFSGIHSDRVVEGDYTDFQVEPTGMVFLIQSDKQEPFESYIQEQFGHTLSQRLWGVENGYAVYEVYLKHVSKASAIKYLLDYYQLPNEQWIALGDGINDVEMIRDAHVGVAMKNGVKELHEVADIITEETHDEEAVAQFLIQFFNLEDFR
ncbi:MAG: Cof-type HAD-IIB family hydrolase [Acholeplasmataceae bacterium]|jgi:Cof subfamily protein (haloacid dehalogenase superfamily)|nr:Cof-type HAD-IIB family hydrolase [Acholeplasmataceae bacterium]